MTGGSVRIPSGSLQTRLWISGATLLIGLYVSVGAIWAWQAPASVGSDAVIIQRAALRFEHGEPVYLDPSGARFIAGGLDLFYGPPALVLAALPLTVVDSETIRHLAFPVSWLLISLALVLVARSVGLRPVESAAVAIGVVLSYAVFGMATLGAPSALVLLCLAGTWWALERGHGVVAAVCLGTAVALRLYPGALLVALLAAGRYRTAAATVLVAGVWSAVALAVVGPDATQTFVHLLPTMGTSDAATSNTSLAAIALGSHGPDVLGGVVRVASTLAGLALLVHGGRTVRSAVEVARRLMGWGLAIAGMLLVCPVVWDHYLTALLILVVAVVAITRRATFGLVSVGLLPAALLGGLSMAWLPVLALLVLRRPPPAVASATVSPDPVLSSAS